MNLDEVLRFDLKRKKPLLALGMIENFFGLFV
jgi:hypothetical protein